MSEIDLFEMEWGDINEKSGLDINPLSLFQEIEKEVSEKLLKERGEGDSTDGAFIFTENLTENLEAEFDEIIGADGDKKQFITSLTKIFAILLSTRADSVGTIKNIVKIAIRLVVRQWSGRN